MSDSVRKAVILLSGGLDSATVLAMARADGFACHALSLDYGQRHRAELAAARRVATALGAVEHKVLPLSLDAIGGSALTDSNIAVPTEGSAGIPVTYVPARNTVFLALALGWAEVLGSTCSSASMRSTIRAIQTAGQRSSQPSSSSPTWRPRSASRAGGFVCMPR